MDLELADDFKMLELFSGNSQAEKLLWLALDERARPGGDSGRPVGV